MKIKRGITLVVLMIAVLLLLGNTHAWAFAVDVIVGELGEALGL